jgi:hypothetical protein
VHDLRPGREQLHLDVAQESLHFENASALLLLSFRQIPNHKVEQKFSFTGVSIENFSRSRNKFNFLRFLVLQMPIAHIAIFLALNLIYIEHIQTFDNVILFFIPFIALTVVGGVWGFNMTIRMLAPHFTNLKLPQKYFAFQLVLVFCKLQPVFLNLVMSKYMTECDGPFTILVKRHSELS